MCTVSWLHEEDGYRVFFNRDERTTRRPALPPSVRNIEGVRCIMPADGDFGGTWVSVNERGVSLCLLNRYQDAIVDPQKNYVSRGHLMLMVAAAASREEACARLVATNLRHYQPFTIAVLEPGSPTIVVDWNGISRAFAYDGEGRMPLVSSGVDPEGVAEARLRLLDAMRGDGGRVTAELLDAFHRSHEPERGSSSPCMHRDDASTVSATRIRVTRDRVALDYHPSAPCAEVEAVSVDLSRRP